MSRPLLAALLAAVLPGLVFAAPVAAELDADPTGAAAMRLAHWPADGWSVQQYGRLVQIRFPGAEIDISPAADLLDVLEGQVYAVDSEIEGGDTYLRITLSCDCRVVLAGDGKGTLGLDVIGAADSAPSDTGPAPLAAPLPIAKAQGEGATEVASAPGTIDPAEVQQRLLEQLMRAAEAGVVDLDPALTPATPEAAPDQDVALEEDMPAPLEAPAFPDAQGLPAPSAGDADAPDAAPSTEMAAAPEPASTTPAGPEGINPEPETPPVELAETLVPPPEPQCFPADAFDFPEVLGNGKFVLLVSELRSQLVGEFDRAETEPALALVRAYLSGEAPEEALAILDSFAPEHPWIPLYREMAHLLQERDLRETASILRTDCVGDQALWRAFANARAGKPATAVTDEGASGRALERMPLLLRQLFAAQLGLAAAEESDWTAARRFEAVAGRAAGGAQQWMAPTRLLSARLASWHGDDERARDLLMRARDEAIGPGADRALLALADLALSSDHFLGAGTSAIQKDLGALGFRMRGTPTGTAAFERHARLMMRSGSRDQAIGFVNDGITSGLYPPEDHASLLSELVSGPTMSELARPLGLIYLDTPERFAEAVSQSPFRHALVRSLAEIGVPALAEGVLAEGDLAQEDVAVPLAEAYLLSRDPRAALEIAQAMPDGDARDRLVAAALLASDLPEGQAAGQVAAATPDAATNIDLSEARLRAALQDGRMTDALLQAVALVKAEPSVERAERAILVALQAGEASVPQAAAAALAESAPERLAELETLFRPIPEGPDEANPAAVAGFMEALDAEISLIERYLQDG